MHIGHAASVSNGHHRRSPSSASECVSLATFLAVCAVRPYHWDIHPRLLASRRTIFSHCQSSLRDRSCKQHYHMKCLTPPLLAKPAKGYSWVCPPCSIQRHKDVQEQRYHYGQSSAPIKNSKAAQKKEKSATSNRADVMYRGWPWRYFG